MADYSMGMFSTPEEVKRAAMLEEQKAFDSAVASGNDFLRGQAMGRRIGGSLGGMLGMKSADEIQAGKIQEMAKVIDWNSPEDLNQFAMALNDMGMTKQAVQVLEKRQNVINQQNADADRAEKIAKGDIRKRSATVPVSVPVWDSKKTKITGYKQEMQNVYWDQTWNPTTQKWEPENPPVNGGAVDGGGAVADYPAVRMPAGEKKVVKDPVTGKDVTLDTNVMVNSKNKPVLDMPMIQGLRNWWDNL